MDTWQRRTLYYTSGLLVVVAVYTLAYQAGMALFEGEQRDLFTSLRVVVAAVTTAGFGSDAANWTTPEMNLLVVLVNATGVVAIFLALPVLVFPLLQDALSTTVPTVADADLDDHVVICTYTPRADPLIAELQSRGVDHLLVEPDRERALELYESGERVIHADPNTVAGLEAAQLTDARALVADVTDEVDASIVLTARETAEDVRLVSVVEEPDRASYHRLAGADEVLSPRPLLGESLAQKVTTGVSTELGEVIDLGEEFEVVELPVHRGSDLVGKTLAESGFRERAGVNVIGGWFRGRFLSPPPPDAEIDGSTVLLLTGREDQLEKLKPLTRATVRRYDRGETVVVGAGEVGQVVARALDAADIPHTVVDVRDVEGVDVVGDATDPEVLRAAGVEDARSVVLCLPDDTTAEFATLVVRDIDPTVEVIARAEEAGSVQKMYLAGADYVLSLANVAGRLTAAAVLEEEEPVSIDTKVNVVRLPAPGLVGQTLKEADVRARTGCTVVAVERDGTVLTDVGPEFRVEAGDEVVVAGADEGVNRFRELLG
jgi:Trk K+ transport system NAD-binding subunit